MTLHSRPEVIICVDGFFFEARDPLLSEILAEAQRQVEQASRLAPFSPVRRWQQQRSKSARAMRAEAMEAEAIVFQDQKGTPR